jgi:hypothetical protein
MNHAERGLKFWAIELGLLALIIIAMAIPRLAGLDRLVTIDEPYWMQGGANFYFALGQGDLAATYHDGHPGVTQLWEGAVGMWRVWPQYRIEAKEYYGNSRKVNVLLLENGIDPLDVMVAAREVAILVNITMLAGAYALFRYLTERKLAVFGFLLLAFSPFFTAHTRFLHQDGQLACFMLISTLAYCAFYLKERSWWFIFLAGITAGAAWLTKIPGLFLGLYFGILTILFALRDLQSAGDRKSFSFRKLITAYFLPLFSVGGIGIATFVAFWPAMWVQPIETIEGMLYILRISAGGGHERPLFFKGETILGGSFGPEYYPTTILWRTTPVVLAGFGLALWGLARDKTPFTDQTVRFLAIAMLTFFSGFLLFMISGNKQFDRYLQPLYPHMILIAGLGWFYALERIAAYWRDNGATRWALPLALIALQLIPLVNHYPYYLTYYNPLLGGGPAALQTFDVGWGEGWDQAAAYLIQQEGYEDFRIVIRGSTAPFAFFFPYQREAEMYLTSGQAVPPTADFIMSYASRTDPTTNPDSPFYGIDPVHTVWLHGIPYVRIYPILELPLDSPLFQQSE